MARRRMKNRPLVVFMAIRLLAKDLYRLIKEVEELEKALEKAPAAGRPAIEEKLRVARAERKKLQNALEGCKN